MTSAGLFVRDNDHDQWGVFLASALFLIVAVPFSAFYLSELSALLFTLHERKVIQRRMSARNVANAPDTSSHPPSATTEVEGNYLAYLEDIARRAGLAAETSPEDPP